MRNDEKSLSFLALSPHLSLPKKEWQIESSALESCCWYAFHISRLNNDNGKVNEITLFN